MNLKSMGWSHYSTTEPSENTARVIAIHRSHLRAVTNEKEINLYRSGQIADDIAVGDWVEVTPEFVDEQNQSAAIIQNVLPRKSKLSRATNTSGEQVFASNIEQVYVVTSANHDLNIKRLHRYLLMINNGGAKAVVVLSKVDLVDNADEIANELEDKLGIKVIPTSLASNGVTGIAELLESMSKDSTSVFVGSSGVGKSSLVNALIGEEVQLVQSIREDDSKGRHTTTARQMFVVPNHGLIIDSPGVRGLLVFGDAGSLEETFPAIEELIQGCRFSDCQHEQEPGCAIQEALSNGALDEVEWQSYLKLLREMQYNQRKVDKAEMANSKKRWKDIHVAVRKRMKFEGKI